MRPQVRMLDGKHALIGMVTMVGKWWSHIRKPSFEKVASYIVALAWIGLRNLPEKPDPISRTAR